MNRFEYRSPASFRWVDVFALIRPAQWIKNIVVFAAPAAGLRLSSLDSLSKSALTFAVFSLAASAAYSINDVVDRKADASHPTKRRRPVAGGRMSPSTAIGIGFALLLAAGVICAAALPPSVGAVLVLYLLITLAYSLSLKERVILDVILISIGFVLRALAGGFAAAVPTSEWLVACVFTLCLFMGFGKRRCEITMLGQDSNLGEHRRTLVRYTPDLLNHLLTVSAGIAVITFLLYTMDTAGHPSAFPKQQLFYTLPLVIYGVFRFAMLTELGWFAGPTEIVLKDRAMLTTLILWTTCALVIAYQKSIFGPAGIAGYFRAMN